MPATTPQPLNIALLGPGRIGSTLAFQLARTGGHAVTVVARSGSVRLRQLERDGGVRTVKDEGVPVQIADQLDEAAPYDLVIVTLLAHQLAPVLPALQRSAAKAILFMFNTFDPEAVSDAVGKARCAFGMPFLQANFDRDGRLDAAIGVAGQKSLLSRQTLVDLFNAAGIPATLESDMPLWLRCHAPVCVAIQSVCGAGEQRLGGCSWGEARVVARGAVEAFALIRALGYSIHPVSKARLSRAPVWLLAGLLWGLSRNRPFRELLATGTREGRALTDAMLAASTPATGAIRFARIAAMKPV